MKRFVFDRLAGRLGDRLGRARLVRAGAYLARAGRLDPPDEFARNGEGLVQQTVARHAAGPTTVVDCGANTGQWSAALLSAFGRRGKRTALRLYCFEPSAPTFEKLTANLVPRAADGVSIYPVRQALSRRAGAATLYVVHEAAGTNSLTRGAAEHRATEAVEATMLTAFARGRGIARIDFLKIDAEGHDLEVLAGARELIDAGAIRRHPVRIQSALDIRRPLPARRVPAAGRHRLRDRQGHAPRHPVVCGVRLPAGVVRPGELARVRPPSGGTLPHGAGLAEWSAVTTRPRPPVRTPRRRILFMPDLPRRAGSLFGALRRHGRDLAAVAAGRGLTVLGKVVGVRVLTEFLPPAVFGRYKLVLAGLSLVTGVLVRPFIQYAMRAYHDAEARGAGATFLAHSRRWFWRYSGWLGLAGAAGGYIFSAAGGLSPPELAGVAAVLALQALVEYDRALFVTRNRQRAAEAIGAAMQWLIPFAVAASVRAGESPGVVLPAHAAALALIVSARRWRGRRTAAGLAAPADPRDRGFETAPAWAFAWPLMVAGCLAWLLHESDRLILGYYHDSGAVGLYAAAYGLVAAPFTAASGAVAQVMYPVVFAASARHGGSPVLPGPMLAGTLLIGLGGVLAVWWWGDLLAAVVLAEGYRAGVSGLLLWIAAGYACFGVAMCFDLAAYGAGRTMQPMAAGAVAAAANVGLDLLLVPAHGAGGAAVATAVALLCYLLCMAGLFARGGRRGQPGTGVAARPGDPPLMA